MISYWKTFYENIRTHPEVWMKPILYTVFILLLAALGWWIFNRVMDRIEKRFRGRAIFEKNPDLFDLLKKSGHYAVILIAGAWLLPLFHAPVVEKIFFALMILLISSIAHSALKTFLPIIKSNVAAKTKSGVDDILIDLAMNFSSVIIYGVGAVLAMDVLGLNITPFLAGAGVAGIAIGFAARDTLSNLIAGVLLIIDRPFELGDRIEIWTAPKNSATWGDVVEIGIRATKIRTTDNIVIVIPNNEIMKLDIVNYTAITADIRIRIPIGIAYDADMHKAKEIIEKVALELPWVKKDPGPKIVVKNFGESAVDLEARVWIEDPRKRIDTISSITDRVKAEFDRAGIEIPYPKRVIYMKQDCRS
ncbi:MAG: mechanosensitive ion channel family protein [Deltaproteobacteria bacterium]|nr:mechanosensitive ion channel family protein [Deltaproteobacteria bacterium]